MRDRAVRPKAIYTTRDGLAGDDVHPVRGFSRHLGWQTDADFFGPDKMGTSHGYLPPVLRRRRPSPFNRTTAFGEDHSGNVWIGFQNGGLARYRDGRFRLFTHADGAPFGGIGALYLDTNSRLWVASARPGLTRSRPGRRSTAFVPYTTALGLSADAGDALPGITWAACIWGWVRATSIVSIQRPAESDITPRQTGWPAPR